MAKYDYKCTNCYEIFEMDFGYGNLNQRPLIYCPTCKSPARRYISYTPRIVFIGPGFVSNDLHEKPDPLEGYES